MHTVKNPGAGVAFIFAKIPGVGSWRSLSFRKNYPRVPYFEFYCIFINKFFWKFALEVLSYTQYPLTPSLLRGVHQTHLFKVFDHGRGQVDVVVVLVEDQGLQVRVEVKLGRVPGGDRILNR